MIISSGTPVDSTQASTRRSTTPGRRNVLRDPAAQRRHRDRAQHPLGLQIADDRVAVAPSSVATASTGAAWLATGQLAAMNTTAPSNHSSSC